MMGLREWFSPSRKRPKEVADKLSREYRETAEAINDKARKSAEDRINMMAEAIQFRSARR